MRILAYHDVAGAIRSFVTFDGPEGTGLMRVPAPAELVTQLTSVEMEPGERGEEQLRAIAKSARVPVPTWNPRSQTK
jgi:hypothetical protein